jgi:hypothetical protein
MFRKSLDEKPLYRNDDGIEMIDIMEGMYHGTYDFSFVHSVYKANKMCTMRPDYLAECLYGDEAYAEIAIKSAMLSNPFALEEGDIVYAMKLSDVYNHTKDYSPKRDKFNAYEMIKRYHKYIDKEKIPKMIGSEENKVESSSEPDRILLEPNISKTGATGVSVKNGRIYFGDNKTVRDEVYAEDIAPEESVSAVGTGSLPSMSEDLEESEENDDRGYKLQSTIAVDDNSLVFNLDSDIEEDYGKYAAKDSSVPYNNIILSEGKIFFTPENGQDTEISGDLEIPVNSDVVNCARTGVSLGTYLNNALNSCNITVEENGMD